MKKFFCSLSFNISCSLFLSLFFLSVGIYFSSLYFSILLMGAFLGIVSSFAMRQSTYAFVARISLAIGVFALYWAEAPNCLIAMGSLTTGITYGSQILYRFEWLGRAALKG